MAFPLLKPTSTGGEIAPSLFGRVDVSKVQAGLSVLRNCFVSFRGGAISRGGTALVGKSKQLASASSIPPQLVRFQFNINQSYILEFGDGYMRVIANGGYVTESPIAITGATQGNPCQISAVNTFADGDEVFIADIEGMTELNGRTFIVANATGATFTLRDIWGDAVNSFAFGAYTTGGTVSRIFTNTQPPYAVEDLQYLKVTQSADVMSLCCVNQETGVEYPTYDLTRLAANNWNFSAVAFASAIAAPASCTATAVVTAAPPTQYAYCVTAVDANGEESVASPVAYVVNSVNIATTAGSIVITWPLVAGAVKYFIYKAPPSYNTAVPVGAQFGYIGTSFGNEFVDINITQDMSKTPPKHLNPFARGAILEAPVTAGGAGYTQATVSASIVTATGSGAVLVPVVVGGAVVAIIIENGGENYADTDTVVIADSGGGAGATADLSVGPQTGTYPGVVNYFQARRVYGYTLNNPDTYFMSQPGKYLNMDASIPAIDSDAITGTPWGVQVNGLQWFMPMPGGLVTFTGQDFWQVAGAGGSGAAITPDSQSAQAQEANGVSPTVAPIKVNQDILYVSSIGYGVYQMQYNFWNNIYAGVDVSVFSSHLLVGFSIKSWAWSLQPFKLMWSARNDGKLLSLTYFKEQEVIGWGRHDTNGFFERVSVASEPPVDALYMVVKRYIQGKKQWAYFIERMDDRIWDGPEDPWCVDCGLALSQPAPNATLTAEIAPSSGSMTGGYLATGGEGYVAPSARINDPTGLGSGLEISFTVIAGVITAFNIDNPGAGYPPSTTIEIIDSSGWGAELIPFIATSYLFSADSSVFTATAIGDVIRMGGGVATVSALNSASQVVADIVSPIAKVVPNDPYRTPSPAAPGEWTITTPVTVITNLEHLEGMEVSVLGDGAVLAGGDMPTLTVENGSITLPQAASQVVVGLPFIAQYQTLYPEIQPTMQGRRKKASGATFRLEKSRGVQGGVDQPVASMLDFQEEVPWSNLQSIPDFASVNAPNGAMPLFTGDKYIPLPGDWQNAANGWEASPCFIAAQQTNPLPMSVLAVVPAITVGDSVG